MENQLVSPLHCTVKKGMLLLVFWLLRSDSVQESPSGLKSHYAEQKAPVISFYDNDILLSSFAKSKEYFLQHFIFHPFTQRIFSPEAYFLFSFPSLHLNAMEAFVSHAVSSCRFSLSQGISAAAQELFYLSLM